MRIRALLIALGLLTQLAHATQQAGERIMIDGIAKYTLSTPLAATQAAEPELWKRLQTHLPEQRCSALWRGYVAQWELSGDELRLVSIAASDCSSTNDIPLERLLPGSQGFIRATWFSGELVFERGPYVEGPCGFSPTCPTGYDVLVFEQGKKIGQEYRPLRR